MKKIPNFEDFSLQGGKGDDTDPKGLDQEELQVGIAVEMEHTSDEEVASEIATDHLTEDPKYYSKLLAAGLSDEHPATKLAKKFGWK